MLLVDAHLDLAMNALVWNRDLKLSCHDTRDLEAGMTAKGRRARYYRLTPAGRAHLRAESERLADYVDALTAVLATRTADG